MKLKIPCQTFLWHISQSEIRNSATKTPSPKPAPPPSGREISAEAGRIHIPSQNFRPAESILIPFKKGSRKVYNYSTSTEGGERSVPLSFFTRRPYQ